MNAKPITAYQCGECTATYVLQISADKCCQPKQCACGNAILKTQWRCNTCKDSDDRLKWECAERGAVLKDGWLYSQTYDRYFQGADEVLDDIEDWNLNTPLEEFARRYQVYICKPHKPKPINLHEHFDEHHHEDDELPRNWQQAENEVNDWIKSVPDRAWPQVPSKIAWNGESANDRKLTIGSTYRQYDGGIFTVLGTFWAIHAFRDDVRLNIKPWGFLTTTSPINKDAEAVVYQGGTGERFTCEKAHFLEVLGKPTSQYYRFEQR